jgi:hypothetical protein
MNLKKLNKIINGSKDLNVSNVFDDTYGYSICYPLWIKFLNSSVRETCDIGIDRRLNLGISWSISVSMTILNIELVYLVPLSSFERLNITESILEEL